MDIADCYRLLQLTSRANAKDLKTSYRRLARQWHPDTNPGDELAHEKFIQVTEAYKILQKIIPAVSTNAAPSSPSPKPPVAPPTTYPSAAQTRPAAKKQATRTAPPSPQSGSPTPTRRATANYNSNSAQTQRKPPAQKPPTSASPGSQTSPLSSAEIKLKIDSYKQLQEFIQTQRFPRAVALIEALAQRLPQDPEVRQWQAIIYQSWGRQLIRERKLNQARAYLKKALNTDPHNKSLWAEIEQDFKKLEMVI